MDRLLANPNGGAVAGIGATEYSWKGYNDFLLAGIFEAMYPGSMREVEYPKGTRMRPYMRQPEYELGKIVEIGKERMFEMYEDRSDLYDIKYTQMHREIFECFGDPAIKVHREAPKVLIPNIFEKDGRILCDDSRNLVIVDMKSGFTQLPIKQDSCWDITDLVETNYLSLVSDGYVPIFINWDSNVYPIDMIESISKIGGECLVSYKSTKADVEIVTFDVFGNIIDRNIGVDGKARMRTHAGFSVVTLQSEGCILDSKTIAQ